MSPYLFVLQQNLTQLIVLSPILRCYEHLSNTVIFSNLGPTYIDIDCVRYHMISDDLRTWHASKFECEAMGGVLASLHTQSIYNAVRQFIVNGNFDHGLRGYWIGLNDRVTEGTFVWLNGEPLTWTAWAPGEPNNNINLNVHGQDCGQIR